MTVRFETVFTIVFVLAVASGAVAQTAANGSVRGYVRDQQGAVLPGATVTALSPGAPTPVAATSDKEGYYRLLDLPPGEYTITAELAGFAKLERPGVIVRAGLNLGIQIELSVGSQNETVTVNAETPMLESRTAVNGVNISGDFQRAMPLSSRRLWTDYLLLSPNVNSIDSGANKNFHVNGATIDSHVFQIDGLDVMSARQNSPLYINVSAEAISDVRVKTSAVDASAPLGHGAIVDLVTRSGTDVVSGSAAYLYQPRQWNDRNVPGGIPQTLRVRHGDASLGGPLRRSRAWFFTSYRRMDNDTIIARTPTQLANLLRIFPSFEPFTSQEIGNFFQLKGVAQLAAGQLLTLSYARDTRRTKGGAATDTDRFTFSTSGGPAYGATLSSVWGSSMTSRLLVSHNRKGIDSDLARMDIPARRVHLGTFLTQGVLTGTGVIGTLDNSSSGPRSEPAEKWTIAGDTTVFMQTRTGSHELQTGIWVQPRIHDESVARFAANGLQFEDVLMRDSSNPALGFVPFHRQISDQPEAATAISDSRDIALYVQDSWRPFDPLTVSVGVRVDFVKRWDRLFDLVVQDSTEVGPRFGVNFRLTERGTVRANWGRVHENLSVGRVLSSTSILGRTDIYDNDLDGVFETVRVTPPTSTLIANRTFDLENLHLGRADEWGVGYLVQLPGEIAVDTSLIQRAYKDRPALVDVNPIYNGSVFQGFRDNTSAQIVRVTKNIWNWPVYTGLEFRVTKQTDRVQFIAGYTRKWRHLEGNWQPNDPASLIQPSAFPNNRGIGGVAGKDPSSLSPFSQLSNTQWRDHTVSAAGTYIAPWALTVAARYSFQSGAWSGPIYRVVPVDPAFGPVTVPLANGTAGQNPLAVAQRFAFPTRSEGQFMLPGVHEVNLRISRDIRWRRQWLNIAVDVFNLLNKGVPTNAPIGFNDMSSPNFKIGDRPQAPRSAQISARFSF